MVLSWVRHGVVRAEWARSDSAAAPHMHGRAPMRRMAALRAARREQRGVVEGNSAGVVRAVTPPRRNVLCGVWTLWRN